MVILSLLKILENFYISDDETDITVGILSRNLATLSNFVRFRDSRNFYEIRGNGSRVNPKTGFLEKSQKIDNI